MLGNSILRCERFGDWSCAAGILPADKFVISLLGPFRICGAGKNKTAL